MAMTFEMPDEFSSGGNFLNEPGKYHCSIIEGDESPTYRGGDKKGQLIDGFRVELSVLSGPNAGKTTDITFYNPKLNSKDGGKFSLQKQAAFLIASGLVHPSKLGQKVDVKLEDAADRQVLVEFESSGDDGKYIDLAWANIYHVDDPKAKDYPRDQKAIDLLPKSMRLDASVFDAMRKKANGSASGSTNGTSDTTVSAKPKAEPKPEPKRETVPPSNVSDNIDDLFA